MPNKRDLLNEFIAANLQNAGSVYRVRHPEHLLPMSDDSAWSSYFVLTDSKNNRSLQPEAELLAHKLNELFPSPHPCKALKKGELHPDVAWNLQYDEDWANPNTGYVGNHLPTPLPST